MLNIATDIEVIAIIEKALSCAPKPNNVTIRVARAIDDHVDPSEYQELRLMDNDNDWRDIPDKTVEEFSDSFAFLEADGFIYYLPRYIIWTIRRYHSSRRGTPYFFMSLLDPGFDKEDIHWKMLSHEQQYAYVVFLKYYYINIASIDEKDKIQPILQNRCKQIGFNNGLPKNKSASADGAAFAAPLR